MTFRRPAFALFLAAALAALALLPLDQAPADHRAQLATPTGTKSILAVSNNWAGTIDLVDPHSFKVLRTINAVPDLDQRMSEIESNPVRLAYFLLIRQEIGEGHDQLVDDAFTSPDGRFIYVSRPSLADVVAIRLRDGSIAWRTPVDGQRSDHMALSPDGRRLLVSASTARTVDVIRTKTGEIVDRIPSGDSPHESNYSANGKKIFHASIGLVYTPLDEPALDSTKGDRWFEVINARTYKVEKRIDIGEKLAEAGYPNMSSAIRPMAIAPGGRWFYFQMSFLHGFVEYDLKRDRITRVAQLPDRSNQPRENYLLDSAHHGLAINPSGKRLCAAGTMDGYVAVVSRKSFNYKIIPVGHVPYWATNSANGRYCFVSVAGDDKVAVISYAKRKLVATIHVGDHPQRMRMGHIRRAYL
jgi:DNA-binding beta-propeller fold protein YncE